MSDLKGKENEQERKGHLRNDDIDPEKSHYNYDLIPGKPRLYQQVKQRVQELKESGSRVQVNSVVAYSNIFTIQGDYAEKIGETGIRDYFSTITDYFKEKFGEENVVSAKVHLDETNPHMHLHFLPVNPENGRLQARTVMNKVQMNQIHEEIPQRLREKGFEVVRGSSENKRYIKDVHEFKAKKAGEDIKRLEKKYVERKEQLNEVEHQLTLQQSQIKDQDKQIEEKERQLEAMTQTWEMQNQKMMQMRLEMDDFLEERRKMKDEIKQMADEKAQIARETSQLILDKQQTENALRTAEKSLKHLENDERMVKGSIRQLVTQHEELKEEFSQDKKEYDEWMDDITPLVEHGQEILEKIEGHPQSAIIQQMAQLQSDHDQLQKDKTRTEGLYFDVRFNFERAMVQAYRQRDHWMKDYQQQYVEIHPQTTVLKDHYREIRQLRQRHRNNDMER